MSKLTDGASRHPRSGLRGVLFDSGDVLMRPTSANEAPASKAPSSIATLRRPLFPASPT